MFLIDKLIKLQGMEKRENPHLIYTGKKRFGGEAAGCLRIPVTRMMSLL